MKKLWKKIGLGLVALTMASQAHALILIEPYGGYDFSLDGEDKTTSSKFDFSGWGYGARLGLQLATIMFGVSYDIMDLDVEPDGGGKISTDQKNFGAFVGWNPMISGIRFWAEYFFDVKNEVENMPDESGDGWGFGIGYKLLIPVAFNAEYRSWSLDDPSPTDTTGSSIFVSVSFPFGIL